MYGDSQCTLTAQMHSQGKAQACPKSGPEWHYNIIVYSYLLHTGACSMYPLGSICDIPQLITIKYNVVITRPFPFLIKLENGLSNYPIKDAFFFVFALYQIIN